MERSRITQTVRQVLADTLELDPGRITPECTLFDDLGAESIDLLDLTYRLERAFGIRIDDEALFEGKFDAREEGMLEAGRVTEAGMARLRAAVPDFDLGRFRNGVVYETDLPRLLTVRTLVDYIEGRLGEEPPP